MKSQAIMMINRVLEIILGILLITTISHILSVEHMGEYQYFNAITSLAMSIVYFWILLSVVRFYDYYELNNRLKEFYKSIRVFVLMAGLIVVVVFAVYGLLSNQLLIALLLAGSLVVQSVSGIIISIQRASHKSLKFAINSMIAVLSRFVLIISLLLLVDERYEFIFVSAIISGLIIIMINYDQFASIFLYDYHNTKPVYKEMISIGIPLALVSSIELLLSLSDRFVINIYYSKVEVGLYSNIYSLASYVFQSIISIFLSSMGPLAIKAWNRDRKGEVNEIVTRNYYYYLMIAIPALFGLQIVRTEFIHIMLGSEYVSTESLLLPISISYLLINSIVFAQKGIEYSNQLKYLMRYGAIATLINLLLNIIFMKRYGYEFAAISTVISYFIYFIMILLIGRKFLKIELKPKLLIQYFVGATIMYVMVKQLHIEGNVFITLGLKALAGLIIYVLILLLFNIRYVMSYLTKRG